MGPYIAKILVEITLFILSYAAQRKLVFRRKGDTNDPKNEKERK